MQRLIAKQSILFESRIYNPGDALPTHNSNMVEAWTAAQTAVWYDDEESKKAIKAKPRTAETGLCGEAISSESEDGENLVGKVPKTRSRSKK